MRKAWGLVLCGMMAFQGLDMGSELSAAGASWYHPGEKTTEVAKDRRFSRKQVEMAFRVLRTATSEGKVPGAVGAIVAPDGLVDCQAFGYRCLDPQRLPMERNTLFDLASLTKMVATTASIGILLDREQITLEDPVSRYLPDFDTEEKRDIRIGHLITHTSGLPAWTPLFREYKGKEAFLQAIAAMPLEAKPGEKWTYSDPGFITLGLIVEKVSGQGLDEFTHENIFQPLGMNQTRFNPPPSLMEDCAATERCAWRKRIVWGEVHDENAKAMGGVAGHAGLFSTADDLARFCRMVMCGGELEGVRILKASTVGLFNTPLIETVDPHQGFGWRIKGTQDASSGPYFSPASFGHTGFTGTSIWFDPERKLASILLTNRVHPSRENQAIGQLRKDFNSAVIEAWEGRRMDDLDKKRTWNPSTGRRP